MPAEIGPWRRLHSNISALIYSPNLVCSRTTRVWCLLTCFQEPVLVVLAHNPKPSYYAKLSIHFTFYRDEFNHMISFEPTSVLNRRLTSVLVGFDDVDALERVVRTVCIPLLCNKKPILAPLQTDVCPFFSTRLCLKFNDLTFDCLWWGIMWDVPLSLINSVMCHQRQLMLRSSSIWSIICI